WSCCPFSCSRSPATICAVAERTPDPKQVVFIAFDPVKGRSQTSTKFDIDAGAEYDWNLSADGTRIAINRQPGDRIYIVPFSQSPRNNIQVHGWSTIMTAVWAADNKGLFVGADKTGARTLLYVDLQGNPTVLWEQKGTGSFVPVWAVPTSDGRRLAIHSSALNSNMWMIEKL